MSVAVVSLPLTRTRGDVRRENAALVHPCQQVQRDVGQSFLGHGRYRFHMSASLRLQWPRGLRWCRDGVHAATAAGYPAYAGRYTVSDAGVIDHLPDVSLFPNWEHTAVPRRATIANNRLTLELVEPLVIDGRPRAGRLTWERVEVFEARTKPLGATGSSELHTAATQGER